MSDSGNLMIDDRYFDRSSQAYPTDLNTLSPLFLVSTTTQITSKFRRAACSRSELPIRGWHASHQLPQVLTGNYSAEDHRSGKGGACEPLAQGAYIRTSWHLIRVNSHFN